MAVVPGKMLRTAKAHLVARRALMDDIEREDIKQLQKQTPGVAKDDMPAAFGTPADEHWARVQRRAEDSR